MTEPVPELIAVTGAGGKTIMFKNGNEHGSIAEYNLPAMK